ncbi:hypothetical protein [Moorena sp. SIO3A5]|uniref:hypothetical protein n=1 Tax=Moorena sp. SIO3A5 TaxID=2607822 RepID=UPI00141D2F1F|nr:hypothetical protein [Moorena sp. SIO3A5]NEP70297.1 hypothetical protein [Moorena sp. SIO3A5]
MTEVGQYDGDIYFDENGEVECAWIAEMRNPCAPEPHCYGPAVTFWGEEAKKFNDEFDAVAKEARETKDNSKIQKFLENKWRGV